MISATDRRVMRPFIPPALPVLRDRPPKGEAWLHEVKFDGYRIQLHKDGDDLRILSKNGHDFSNRYPRLISQLKHLPCKNAVIDAEAVVSRNDGTPDFRALHSGNFAQEQLVAWCFDILSHNSNDLRPMPLITRRHHLQKLLANGQQPALMLSECFNEAEALLAECGKRSMEGIVSKKKGAPYRSGKCDWIKVKCAQWKADNQKRFEHFKA